MLFDVLDWKMVFVLISYFLVLYQVECSEVAELDTTGHSPTFLSLHLCHNSFSNPSVALPTSQLILQLFRCFAYITAHSPTLLSLLLRHRLFIYVTWRAAHGSEIKIRYRANHALKRFPRYGHVFFLVLYVFLSGLLLFGSLSAFLQNLNWKNEHKGSVSEYLQFLHKRNLRKSQREGIRNNILFGIRAAIFNFISSIDLQSFVQEIYPHITWKDMIH